MKKDCIGCGIAFEITDEDLQFYDAISPTFAGKRFPVPSPTRCPDCRFQRRLTFRNERTLYRRPCALCNRPIISAYSSDKLFIVYCQECWWGDSWDALAYGKDFDFSRPFFDQYHDLQRLLPRIAVMNKAPENSEYCNYAGYNKNCYLAVGGSWHNEDCSYGTYYSRSRDSIDCYGLSHGEVCYDVMWGENLHGCAFISDCFNSNDCFFSSNLRGCKNCILCFNLRNKEYYIRNKSATKEEFETLRKSMESYKAVESLRSEWFQLMKKNIHPAALNINCEQCTGDYLRNCKNVLNSFEVTDVEDGKYLFRCEESKDLMDCSATGYNGSQLFYETINAGDGGEHNLFSFNNWACSDILYCDTPQSARNCFGCISVKRKQYCILNKQYSKEAYELLMVRIMEHMQKTKEWGEFFPVHLSPFCYNETNAQEHSPLSQQESLRRGYSWKENPEDIPKAEKMILAKQLPDAIQEIPDDIVNWAITCEVSGRLFKIIKQELDFYRSRKLPAPHLHPDARHKRLMALRNPNMLWDRMCQKCAKVIKTTYAPDRKEIVYCQECYLKEVY